MTKKDKCLQITTSGSLLMKDEKLAIQQITVCPTTLRFVFSPTRLEKDLPIKDHVDGPFEYTLPDMRARP